MAHSIIVLFGMICLGQAVLSIGTSDGLTVSDDILVKLLPEGATGSSKRTDVSLTCTGSDAPLEYYIANIVTWTFINNSGAEIPLTNGFYQAKVSEKHFDSGHYHFYYVGEGRLSFHLNITDVTDADDGIYRCSQIATYNNTVLSSRNVTLTVVRPVDNVEFELRDGDDVILANTSLLGKQYPVQIVVPPGEYTITCNATGSNPGPSISMKQNGDGIPNRMKDISRVIVAEQAAKRVRYGSMYERQVTIMAEPRQQRLECSASMQHYPTQTVLLDILVDVPEVTCRVQMADEFESGNITCNISAAFPLDCKHVSLVLGDTEFVGMMETENEASGTGELYEPHHTAVHENVNKVCVEHTSSEHISMLVTTFVISESGKSVDHDKAYNFVYGHGTHSHVHSVFSAQKKLTGGPDDSEEEVPLPSIGSRPTVMGQVLVVSAMACLILNH